MKLHENPKKISRQDEQDLPDFSSHEEAREYFKGLYGKNFMLTESQVIDDEKLYFYILILNSDAYYAGQKQLADEGIVYGLEYMDSLQSVEIWEDGRIHVVH